MTPGEAIRKYCIKCVGSAYNVRTCGGDKLLDGSVCPFFKYRMGTDRPSVKTIRKFCLNCMNNNSDMVRNCPSRKTCFLYPYRFGKNPAYIMSEEKKEELVLRFKNVKTKTQ